MALNVKHLIRILYRRPHFHVPLTQTSYFYSRNMTNHLMTLVEINVLTAIVSSMTRLIHGTRTGLTSALYWRDTKHGT